ncbi:uncharacterized protein LOC124160776 [Ischnura elegans]|uniref:uncharacterized protein LOC124160776 n=1 Tax=Ischnura elegans TaxID=197161 RepID=UPI001ED886FA|nr:uncharacterized protein LOC124160776 [Ischnura elegans]
MIEKREENSSPITAHGLHESISTISLETIDLYLKQLEAQKLQAQAEISNSFRQLTSLLHAREKQLLRQVDAIHDHLILILQSRKTFSPDTSICCEDEEKEFMLQEQDGRPMNDVKSVKASPGIELTLITKELEDQILTIGKVEMSGTSFMHLSEDNENFIFPCRVQNYQETSQDHMLLYKSLEEVESIDVASVKIEASVVEMQSENIVSTPDMLHREEVSNCSGCQVLAVNEEIVDESIKELEKLGSDNEKKDESLKKLSNERSEDVQHWMREILNETNSEPTSCDPERFDLFTVLKHNLSKEDLKQEKLKVRPGPMNPSNVSATVALDKYAECCTKEIHNPVHEESPAISGAPSECDLIE